ncbi:STAS domain-containing protein [Kineococcus sp. NPDC059986]|jgi:anti-anti-sigma factor|uniref:STAS domain-containing protein n=1 Tax=Kineococcus sp. NPDC059986 TaxID=3155538 RepID=UPI00344CC05A
MNFSTRTTLNADVATVVLRGELDVSNLDTVQACVDRAVARSRVVIVDLSGVSVADCAAIGAFVSAARYADRRGGWLVLAEARFVVQLLLHALELDSLLGGKHTVATEQLRATQPLRRLSLFDAEACSASE